MIWLWLGNKKKWSTDTCFDIDELENELGERSHSQNAIDIFHSYEMSKIAKSMQTKNRLVVA